MGERPSPFAFLPFLGIHFLDGISSPSFLSLMVILLLPVPHLLSLSSELLASKSSFGSSQGKVHRPNWAAHHSTFSYSSEFLWQCYHFFLFLSRLLIWALIHSQIRRAKCPSDQILLVLPSDGDGPQVYHSKTTQILLFEDFVFLGMRGPLVTRPFVRPH